MPPAPPPIPILSYDTDPTFGWKDTPDGESLLVLPPIPRGEVLAEQGAGLFVSTGFMLLCGGAVILAARTTADSPADTRLALLTISLLPALAAIGVWVLVLLRFVQLAGSTRAGAIVSVTGDRLHVGGGLPPGPAERQWPRTDIIGLRLDPVRGVGGRRLRQVRLQIAAADETIAAIRLPWPAGEATEMHEARLREAVGLEVRSVGRGRAP